MAKRKLIVGILVLLFVFFFSCGQDTDETSESENREMASYGHKYGEYDYYGEYKGYYSSSVKDHSDVNIASLFYNTNPNIYFEESGTGGFSTQITMSFDNIHFIKSVTVNGSANNVKIRCGGHPNQPFNKKIPVYQFDTGICPIIFSAENTSSPFSYKINSIDVEFVKPSNCVVSTDNGYIRLAESFPIKTNISFPNNPDVKNLAIVDYGFYTFYSPVVVTTSNGTQRLMRCPSKNANYYTSSLDFYLKEWYGLYGLAVE